MTQKIRADFSTGQPLSIEEEFQDEDIRISSGFTYYKLSSPQFDLINILYEYSNFSSRDSSDKKMVIRS